MIRMKIKMFDQKRRFGPLRIYVFSLNQLKSNSVASGKFNSPATEIQTAGAKVTS